ncbi:hypothetical protein HQ584_08605 [Patescibacteria group bacterium]|nr:hypothetical protein [Patescibacteria group bacterium]
MDEKLKIAITKSAKGMLNSLPILVGVVLLIGLASTLIPKSFYNTLFSKNVVLDSIVGSGLGSILAGNPVTSYVIGGELLKQGISLVAVTSFLVAWVTVGLVQFPAEALLLGRRFAILRNILSFVFSIIVAIITVFIVGLV